MGPGERAYNIGANGKYYEQTCGIKYDAVTDALYKEGASGEREYILKGDLGLRLFS